MAAGSVAAAVASNPRRTVELFFQSNRIFSTPFDSPSSILHPGIFQYFFFSDSYGVKFRK